MPGLLTHNNYSIDSVRTSSGLSVTTSNPASDTYTVENGIGTLSGRVIYAVGEVALRGIDQLAIHSKLRLIDSIFPHDDNARIKNMESKYDAVLELSRPGLYLPQIRERVLRVLIIQIARGHTRHFLRYLMKWPTIEIALLLSEIMACMPQDWLPVGSESSGMRQRLMEAYLSCYVLHSHGNHAAYPLFIFISKLARINDSGRQAVLDAGLLDMLTCMYACDFSGRIYLSYTRRIDAIPTRGSILKVSTEILATICREPGALQKFQEHPISALWPKDDRLKQIVDSPLFSRHVAWRKLDKPLAIRRLGAISLMATRKYDILDPLEHILCDLSEFSDECHYGKRISQDALELLHEYLRDLGASSDDVLRNCTFSASQRLEVQSLTSTSPGAISDRDLIEDVLPQGTIFGKGSIIQGELITEVSGFCTASNHSLAEKFEVITRLEYKINSAVYLIREVFPRPTSIQGIHCPRYDIESGDTENLYRKGEYGRKLALKCIARATLNESGLAARMVEFATRRSIKMHPNIITLYQIFETPSYLFFVLEHVPGDDLFYFMEQARDGYHQLSYSPEILRPLNSPSQPSIVQPSQNYRDSRFTLIASMFSQMCDAVAACHEQKIFRSYLDPESFIIMDEWNDLGHGKCDHKVAVKLADPSSSTTGFTLPQQIREVSPYMSHECRKNPYSINTSYGADIWSLGIILMYMLYHTNPWTDTADGACEAFKRFRRQPVSFLMQRFDGMTLPVAEYLANRVFCIPEGTNHSHRVQARELGRWAQNLPHLLSIDSECEDFKRNLTFVPRVVVRVIRRASKSHTRRGVRIVYYSLSS